MLSLPTRECGLKSEREFLEYLRFKVTPYAGVWIEIFVSGDFIYTKIVTPYAGVWIEMTSI